MQFHVGKHEIKNRFSLIIFFFAGLKKTILMTEKKIAWLKNFE
jgi:hypothetical protein